MTRYKPFFEVCAAQQGGVRCIGTTVFCRQQTRSCSTALTRFFTIFFSRSEGDPRLSADDDDVPPLPPASAVHLWHGNMSTYLSSACRTLLRTFACGVCACPVHAPFPPLRRRIAVFPSTTVLRLCQCTSTPFATPYTPAARSGGTARHGHARRVPPRVEPSHPPSVRLSVHPPTIVLHLNPTQHSRTPWVRTTGFHLDVCSSLLCPLASFLACLSAARAGHCSSRGSVGDCGSSTRRTKSSSIFSCFFFFFFFSTAILCRESGVEGITSGSGCVVDAPRLIVSCRRPL